MEIFGGYIVIAVHLVRNDHLSLVGVTAFAGHLVRFKAVSLEGAHPSTFTW